MIFLELCLERGNLKLHLLTFFGQPLLLLIDRSTVLRGLFGFQPVLLKFNEFLLDRFVMMDGGLGLNWIKILLVVLGDKFLVEVRVLPG